MSFAVVDETKHPPPKPPTPKPSPAPPPAPPAASLSTPEAKDAMEEAMAGISRSTPVMGGSKSKSSPLTVLGLEIDPDEYNQRLQPKVTKVKQPKKSTPKKSSLKQTSQPDPSHSTHAQDTTHGDAGEGGGRDAQTPEQGGQAPGLAPAFDAAAAEGGADAANGVGPGAPSALAPSPAAPSRRPASDAADDGGDDPHDYEFDHDAQEPGVPLRRSPPAASRYSLPLEPLKPLESLHKIIPLDDLLGDFEESDSMVISTEEFNGTMRAFKLREQKYQEAVQMLEERNRTLQKILVERDNQVAYLQVRIFREAAGPPRSTRRYMQAFR